MLVAGLFVEVKNEAELLMSIDGKIICVPYTISKKKFQKLISTALK